MDTLPVTYKMLTPGLKLVLPDFPNRPPRVVKRVDQARARGYLVVSFEDGERTSGHESTVCFVQA
jgi:hypothetical protein